MASALTQELGLAQELPVPWANQIQQVLSSLPPTAQEPFIASLRAQFAHSMPFGVNPISPTLFQRALATAQAVSVAETSPAMPQTGGKPLRPPMPQFPIPNTGLPTGQPWPAGYQQPGGFAEFQQQAANDPTIPTEPSQLHSLSDVTAAVPGQVSLDNPQQTPGTGTFAGGQWPFTYDPKNTKGSSDLSPDEWSWMSRVLGSNARQAYQNFTANYTVSATPLSGPPSANLLTPAGTPLDNQSVALGNAYANPQQYIFKPVQQETEASAGDAAFGDFTSSTSATQRDQQGVSAQQAAGQTGTITPRQWAITMQRSIFGIAAVAVDQIYGPAYEVDTGQPMPADLRQQLIDAINNAPQEDQIAVMQQVARDPSGSTSGSTMNLSWLNNVIATYESEHPSKSQEQKKLFDRLDGYFRNYLGRGVTQADIDALGPTPADTDVLRYIDNQPSKIKGLNYGEYTFQQNRLDPIWNQYFGRAPTDQELAWANGKSTDDVNTWVMQQPSRVKGVTLGRYKGIKDGIDQDASKLFGAGATDEMIRTIHESVK